MKKEEREQLRARFKQDIQSAIKRSGMKDVEIANKAGMTDSNFSYYKNNGVAFINPNVRKLAEVLDMDISYLPEKQETLGSFPQTVEKVNIKPTIIEIKEKQDGKFFVRWEGSYGETAEIMTADELAELKKRMSVPSGGEMDKSTVLSVEPVNELDINEEKGLWVDGEKYTADIIRKMVEASVNEHRVFIELDQAYDEACSKIKELEAINADLITKAQELKDKYEELRGQLSGKEVSSLENMTIGDAVKHYRALKRILRDEVLQ